MTTVENLTGQYKLLGRQVAKNHKESPNSGIGQFSLVFPVSFKIWGKQIGTLFTNIGRRISSKVEQEIFLSQCNRNEGRRT
jgi:hypothetical protein